MLALILGILIGWGTYTYVEPYITKVVEFIKDKLDKQPEEPEVIEETKDEDK
jgi:hypothetical protein